MRHLKNNRDFISQKELKDIQKLWALHIEVVAQWAIDNIAGGKIRVASDWQWKYADSLCLFERDKAFGHMSKSGARAKIQRYVDKGFLIYTREKGSAVNATRYFAVNTTHDFNEMFHEARTIVIGIIGHDAEEFSRDFIEKKIVSYLMYNFSPTFISKYLAANKTGVTIL